MVICSEGKETVDYYFQDAGGRNVLRMFSGRD
jgi:hypothetical protein